MASWFRSWHGAPTDSKWLVIAKRAGVNSGMVSAIFWALLDFASQAEPRGSVLEFDIETYALWAGWDEEKVAAVIDAMTAKNIINDGSLTSWEKRQPKREDDSTQRVAKLRSKLTVTQGEQENVTHSNAVKRNVTQCNNTDTDTDTDTEQRRTDIALSAPLAAEKEKHQNGKVETPLPVEPTPTHKPVKAKKEKTKPVLVDEPQPTEHQEMFGALCQIVFGHSTYTALSGKNKAQLGTESSNLLKIGATPETVAVWYKEKWRSVWPGNKGTAPSFEQVRNGVAAYIESLTLPIAVDTVLSFDLEDVLNV